MRRRPSECDGRVPRGIASRGYARAGAIPACSRGRVFQLHPATTRRGLVGNPHRATSSSRRIPSRRARAVVHGTHDASRDTSVAPSGPERVARGSEGPGGDHAGTRPSRRVGEPETRGTATTRRHGRCAGAGCGRSTPWGGTHHVCYVRLCVLALRGVKLRGVACGAGDVLVFLLSGNPSYVFPQVSRTVVQSEIPQLSN